MTELYVRGDTGAFTNANVALSIWPLETVCVKIQPYLRLSSVIALKLFNIICNIELEEPCCRHNDSAQLSLLA
jgi:hypothetical protein